jgi:hypothetical protein
MNIESSGREKTAVRTPTNMKNQKNRDLFPRSIGAAAPLVDLDPGDGEGSRPSVE